jgi:dockerin type I repeat protein
MSEKLFSKTVLIVVLCAIICTGAGIGTDVCFAKTYYVSKTGNDSNTGESWVDAFLTIKKATDFSVSNDEIWVAEGTYVEGEIIEVKSGVSMYGGFEGSETSVEDRDTSESKTIIDGDNLSMCVYNFGTVDGFYVINGNAVKGGGIYNIAGTIENCMISSNTATNDGGGIYNDAGIINNCEVYSNFAESDGGGIYNDDGSITNSIIYSNSIRRGRGGGVCNFGTMLNCRVHSNSATGNSRSSGGGIYNSGTASNCLVYSNSVSAEGGGIRNGGRLYNCTVYSNSGMEGAGIYHSSGKITNCISWNNKNMGDVYIRDSTDIILYSCFGEAKGLNGNIRANPLFVNTTGDISSWDFHLQNGSPCIDTGYGDNIPNDFEGNPRPGNDRLTCMGVYESPDNYEPSEIPVPLRLYVNKSGDNTDGSSWANAFNSINDAINYAGDRVSEIWVAEGIYVEGETVVSPARSSLYGGFTGNETLLEERDVLNNETVIDGDESYRCISNFGTLDAFSITKGNAVDGAGIYNYLSQVKNCRIYSNLGTGIYNNFGTVSDCSISSNTSRGMYNIEGIISGCILNFNSGGGINDNHGTISNCILYANSAAGNGGGIYSRNYGKIKNCTVYGNYASYGGGIYLNESDVTSCILWNNENQDYSEQFNSSSSIKYSCYMKSKSGKANIDSDPMFLNCSGDISTWDFHLRSESPCIDSAETGVSSEDINGVHRPQGAGWDMGAYEFFTPQTGDVNMDNQIDNSDIEMINDYICGKRNLYYQQNELSDYNQDGKIDVADIISLIQFLQNK